MKRTKQKIGHCPICGAVYTYKNCQSRHHLYPQAWYTGGLKLPVCSLCHIEFHRLNPMWNNVKWSKLSCLGRWIRFIENKGIKPFKIYPQLKEELDYEQRNVLGRAMDRPKWRKVLV